MPGEVMTMTLSEPTGLPWLCVELCRHRLSAHPRRRTGSRGQAGVPAASRGTEGPGTAGDFGLWS